MNIGVRLYRVHDIDLVSLYKSSNFNFHEAVRRSLRAYVRHEPYFMYMPKLEKEPKEDYKYVYQCSIKLDDEKDADVIEFLNTRVKKAKRTAAVKAILRGSLIGTVAYACFEDVDGQEDEDVHANILTEQIKAMYPGIREPPMRVAKKKRSEQASRRANNTDVSAARTQHLHSVMQAHPVMPITPPATPQILKSYRQVESTGNQGHIQPVEQIQSANIDNSIASFGNMPKKNDAFDASNAEIHQTVETTQKFAQNDQQTFAQQPASSSSSSLFDDGNDGFMDFTGFGDMTDADSVNDPANNSSDDDFDLFGDIENMLQSFQ